MAAAAVLSAGVLLPVLGCAATQTPDDAKPAAVTAESATDPSWPVLGFGGSGQLSEGVAVPKGANSLLVTFVCTDGMFFISTGGDMSMDRRGGCGGAQTYSFSVTNLRDLVVSVSMLKEDATFALTGEFSRAKTEPDASTASDCEVFSTILSDVFNARDGFEVGDVDGAAWLVALDETRTNVQKLSDNPDGLIGQQVPLLTEVLAGDHAIPNSLTESTPFITASDLVGQACDANRTPVIIMAEYGG